MSPIGLMGLMRGIEQRLHGLVDSWEKFNVQLSTLKVQRGNGMGLRSFVAVHGAGDDAAMGGRGGAAHEEVGGQNGPGKEEAAEAELEPIGSAGGRNDHGGLGELGGGIDGLAGGDGGRRSGSGR